MARRPRFHSPNSTYHVMLRGNNGQDIFLSDSDRSRMCLLLQQSAERLDHKIEAYCFMSNHIHLAVRVSDNSLSKFMHHLSFRYVQYFNFKYKRVGHLFQGRFKSVLVDETSYLKELIRYIHLNPVRANMVLEPQHYLWSSHRVYLGLDELTWLSKERVLNRFHQNTDIARSAFCDYVLNGIGIKTDFDFKTGCIEGVLGDEEFVGEALKIESLKKRQKIDLSEVATKICEIYDLKETELCAPGKNVKESQARALLSLIVREIGNLSLESAGKFLGRNSSGLIRLATRLEKKSYVDGEIAEKITIMRSWLMTYE